MCLLEGKWGRNFGEIYFGEIWAEEIDLDTCRTTKFDIEKSLVIEIYSPKDHNFTLNVRKVEIVLDDKLRGCLASLLKIGSKIF